MGRTKRLQLCANSTMLPPGTDAVELNGELTVSFRVRAGKVQCTALQFDIVGMGDTKAEALQEMTKLLTYYFEEIISSDEPVRFYNPSDTSEWNIKDQQHYILSIIMRRKRDVVRISKEMRTFIESLKQYKQDYQGVVLGSRKGLAVYAEIENG